MTSPAERWQRFCEAVRAVMDSWTALTLAVNGQWGGSESAQRKEEFILDVIYYFENCSWLPNQSINHLPSGKHEIDANSLLLLLLPIFFDYFRQSGKGEALREEVLDLLYEGMENEFNAVLEDKSPEEVNPFPSPPHPHKQAPNGYI
jgi:hypothetical protein